MSCTIALLAICESLPQSRNMEMEIIRAQATQVDLIVPLFDAYRQFYGAPSEPAAARQFLLDRLTCNESVIFLAFQGKAAVGFVQLYPLFASVALQTLWLLNDLYVAFEARRQGVGETLLKEAEEFARTTGSRGLFLRTGTENFPAQRLYERCGWVRDEQFYRYDRLLG
jgi:GNAT superfamily N-acetyltransferase